MHDGDQQSSNLDLIYLQSMASGFMQSFRDPGFCSLECNSLLTSFSLGYDTIITCIITYGSGCQRLLSNNLLLDLT